MPFQKLQEKLHRQFFFPCGQYLEADLILKVNGYYHVSVVKHECGFREVLQKSNKKKPKTKQFMSRRQEFIPPDIQVVSGIIGNIFALQPWLLFCDIKL